MKTPLLFTLAFLSLCLPFARSVDPASLFNQEDATQSALYAAAAYCDAPNILQWDCIACTKIAGVESAQPVVHVSLLSYTYGYTTFNTKTQDIVVAFRGTGGVPGMTDDLWKNAQSALNWVTNLDAGMSVVQYPAHVNGSRVHSGFMNAYEGAKEQVLSAVLAMVKVVIAKRIVVVGHSLVTRVVSCQSHARRLSDTGECLSGPAVHTTHLRWCVCVCFVGGALATLAAAELAHTLQDTEDAPPIALYTFGSPRVGNAAFAEYVNNMLSNTNTTDSGGSWRVVNGTDPVTVIPPQTALMYEHIAQGVVLRSDGTVRVCDGAKGEDSVCFNEALAGGVTGVDSHMYYMGQSMSGMCTESTGPSYFNRAAAIGGALGGFFFILITLIVVCYFRGRAQAAAGNKVHPDGQKGDATTRTPTRTATAGSSPAPNKANTTPAMPPAEPPTHSHTNVGGKEPVMIRVGR